jgi:DNA-binding transcriptional MerR regulator
MKIGDIAKRSGLSAHTLRYYERIGLLPAADRDASKRRDYDASILTWIAFLDRLKSTGMPIRERLRYAELRNGGSATERERRALLEEHRQRVRSHIAELQAGLRVLNAKIAGYAEIEQRMESHDAGDSGERKPAGARQARARRN